MEVQSHLKRNLFFGDVFPCAAIGAAYRPLPLPSRIAAVPPPFPLWRGKGEGDSLRRECVLSDSEIAPHPYAAIPSTGQAP